MSSPSPPKLPRLVAGVDVKSLPLGAVEGFVLSRVDGSTSVAELASLTGLGEARLGEILARLEQVGAVELVEGVPEQPRKVAPAPPSRDRPTPARGIPVKTLPPPPGGARGLYDPSELEEDVELDLDRRRKVLDTFYQLDTLTYYELLGVDRAADKKAVRTAYFDLAKVFHPDTLFRKRLGSYKSKMEAVFKRLTEAYETLSKTPARKDYDAYLALGDATRAAEDGLLEGEIVAEQIERDTGVASVAPPGAVVQPSVPHGASVSQPPSTPSPLPPSVSAQERRRRVQELLQRRLQGATGKLRPPGMVTSVPPGGTSSAPPPPGAHGKGVLHGLTRTLKQAADVTGGGDRATRQVAEAHRLETLGDVVGAANAMRLALAYASERPDVQAEYERLRKLVAVQLADAYTKQAEYEERGRRHQAAAVSWAKVCEGRPDDARAHRQAAVALLASDGDLRKAQKYAQRSVDLEPNDAKNRRTLGQVFVKAGLRLNARRELEAALKLDPQDDLVKNLLREIRD